MIKETSQSLTRQYKVVFPCHLNSNETLFGGEVLKWMDETAFITASRYAHQKMFTVYLDHVKFLKTVKKDSIVEISGEVVKTSSIKIFVKVEVYIEDILTGIKEKAITADFTFVILDEKGKVKKLICDLKTNK